MLAFCALLRSLRTCLCALLRSFAEKAADVWKKDVWDFQAFSQTFLELRSCLGNEGKDGKNLNSQTWPGTPRHPRPPICARLRAFACFCVRPRLERQRLGTAIPPREVTRKKHMSKNFNHSWSRDFPLSSSIVPKHYARLLMNNSRHAAARYTHIEKVCNLQLHTKTNPRRLGKCSCIKKIVVSS